MKIQDDRCLMDVRVVGYQFPDRVPDKRETVDYDANWAHGKREIYGYGFYR